MFAGGGGHRLRLLPDSSSDSPTDALHDGRHALVCRRGWMPGSSVSKPNRGRLPIDGRCLATGHGEMREIVGNLRGIAGRALML